MSATPAVHGLARVMVAIVRGDWPSLRAAVAALAPLERGRALRETLLQAGVFAGMPRLVRAYDELAGALDVTLDDDEREDSLDGEEVRQRGERFFALIYGSGAERVRASLRAHHPELERLVIEQAYGAVLARPGLTPAARELLAVAALAALDQERQLASHVRGAQRAGAGADAPRAVLDALRDFLGDELHARAVRVAERFREEH